MLQQRILVENLVQHSTDELNVLGVEVEAVTERCEVSVWTAEEKVTDEAGHVAGRGEEGGNGDYRQLR